MSDDIVISIANIGKAYRIWESPAARLTSPVFATAGGLLGKVPPGPWLARRAARSYRDFWALKDVSFDIKRGESVGIIGKNGSGKSTLLQIIAGTLQATEGSVQVRGRVAALLELGAGFDPEFTGRENVHLNAAVLGLPPKEVERRFDEIADFADIGSFMDQPVKTYSTGMLMRLGFAVQIQLDPDILIVDEALSVGDVFFQQKCFKHIHSLIDRGVTLLFVSHDTAAVQNLCSRAILLSKGRVVFEGAPEEAASRYHALNGPAAEPGAPRPGQPGPTVPTDAAAAAVAIESPGERRESVLEILLNNNLLDRARSRHGAGRILVRAATVISQEGINVLDATLNDSIRILFLLEATEDVSRASFGIHLFDRMNECIFAAGARNLGTPLRDLKAGETLVACYELSLSVAPGQYTLSIGCSADSAVVDGDPNLGTVDDRHEGIGPLTVRWPQEKLFPFYGKARLEANIRYFDTHEIPTADLLRR